MLRREKPQWIATGLILPQANSFKSNLPSLASAAKFNSLDNSSRAIRYVYTARHVNKRMEEKGIKESQVGVHA